MWNDLDVLEIIENATKGRRSLTGIAKLSGQLSRSHNLQFLIEVSGRIGERIGVHTQVL